jgi:hypothetical protein
VKEHCLKFSRYAGISRPGLLTPADIKLSFQSIRQVDDYGSGRFVI